MLFFRDTLGTAPSPVTVHIYWGHTHISTTHVGIYEPRPSKFVTSVRREFTQILASLLALSRTRQHATMETSGTNNGIMEGNYEPAAPTVFLLPGYLIQNIGYQKPQK